MKTRLQHTELAFLGDFHRQNGYENQQIHKVLNRPPNISKPNKPSSDAFLPQHIFNRISRVLV
jgi:hypothetical protein